MNILVPRASAIACVLALSAVPLSGCVVPGGGYGYGGGDGGGVGFADYYQPSVVSYGGWGAGYQVGPPRIGDQGTSHGDIRSRSHAYRAAPASHRLPSIPSHHAGGGGMRKD